jgi:hypothetical protein
VRENTTIPVPAVLDWNDNPDNPVGSEYIIMEHVDGIQLVKKWSDMDPLQHFDCVRSLTALMREMMKLSFPAYGGIYFDTAPLHQSEKIHLKNGFCIGPVTSPEYWPGAPEEKRFYSRRPPNRGPCKFFCLLCLIPKSQHISREGPAIIHCGTYGLWILSHPRI